MQLGDIDAEPEAANLTTMQQEVTQLDMVHKRDQLMAMTNRMALTQASPDWPRASWSEASVESQTALLSRRRAAIFASFLVTDVPRVRDEAGSTLVWNERIKVMLSGRDKRSYCTGKSGLESRRRQAQVGRLRKAIRRQTRICSIVNLPVWLAEMAECDVRAEFQRIAKEAVRKLGVAAGHGTRRESEQGRTRSSFQAMPPRASVTS